MKKIMAVLTVLMCFASMNVFAQLKEVRGVQTREVNYLNEDGRERRGFEFKNENNYAVWVEAELCTNGYTNDYSGSYKKEVKAGTCDTKSFTLQAGESYVWKVGDRMLVFYSSDYKNYYVKYKAYKAE